MKKSVKPYLFPSPKRASMLIISVWVLVFFSILIGAVYNITSTQLGLARRIRQWGVCLYLAKAAVNHAKIIRSYDQTAYDTLYELRKEQTKELGRGEFKYLFIDEESKININKASSTMLSRLPSFDEELAEDVRMSTRRPFLFNEELFLVEGITQEIYQEIENLITVYGSGRVNINTAGEEVLTILGMDGELINKIIEYRRGDDEIEATEDDGIFESEDNIIANLSSYTSLSANEQALIFQLVSQGLLGTQATDLSLQITTEVQKKPALTYTVIMDKQKIKRWMEM